METTLKSANNRIAELSSTFSVREDGESAQKLLEAIREIKVAFPDSLAAKGASEQTLNYLEQVAKGTWHPL